jgi:hypothetical protein
LARRSTVVGGCPVSCRPMVKVLLVVLVVTVGVLTAVAMIRGRRRR